LQLPAPLTSPPRLSELTALALVYRQEFAARAAFLA
jgi:hypothetical protein